MNQVTTQTRERSPLDRAESPPTNTPVAPPARSSLRPFLILGGVLLVGLCAFGAHTLATAGQESTDDAQIEGDVIALAPRVGGHVKSVLIKDNQRVRKGDVLLLIEDDDLRVGLAQAEAELAVAHAQAHAAQAQAEVATAGARGGLHNAQARVASSQVGVHSADAQVLIARAALKRAQTDVRKAQLDLTRGRDLRASNVISPEALESSELAYSSAVSTQDQAEAKLSAAEDERRAAVSNVAAAQGTLAVNEPIDAQIASAAAQIELASARVQAAQALVTRAKLQLGYATVTAPEDGVVSRLGVRPGQLVSANQPIADLVPGRTYILANFKETQIDRMKPGASAEIAIDAYSGREFHGQVESLAAGTGSRFSLLPPDNASGNFVKVVQRVPVRIAWHPPSGLALRVGLSADVTVHVD
jgi:membrane fusion protein (multidrug efflux system)